MGGRKHVKGEKEEREAESRQVGGERGKRGEKKTLVYSNGDS